MLFLANLFVQHDTISMYNNTPAITPVCKKYRIYNKALSHMFGRSWTSILIFFFLRLHDCFKFTSQFPPFICFVNVIHVANLKLS